jgi:hypothetical protein
VHTERVLVARDDQRRRVEQRAVQIEEHRVEARHDPRIGSPATAGATMAPPAARLYANQ